jgi:hypothetical protein
MVNSSYNCCGTGKCWVCPTGSHYYSGSCISNNCTGTKPSTTTGTIIGLSTFNSGESKAWAYSSSATTSSSCIWGCDSASYHYVDNATFKGCVAGMQTCITDIGCKNSAVNNAKTIVANCSSLGLGYSCYECNSGYTWNSTTEECETESCESSSSRKCFNSSSLTNAVNISFKCSTGYTCFKCSTGYTWNGETCSLTSNQTAGSIYAPTSSELSAGYTKSISNSDKIKVAVDGTNYYLSIIGTTSPLLVNISGVQISAFSTGEEKKFDLDNDNYYDLKVKFNSVTSGSASFTLTTIREAIDSGDDDDDDVTTTCSDSSGVICDSDEECSGTMITTDDSSKCCVNGECSVPEEPESGNTWIIILVIVIIIICIIIFVLLYFGMKKGKGKKPEPGKPSYSFGNSPRPPVNPSFQTSSGSSTFGSPSYPPKTYPPFGTQPQFRPPVKPIN